MPYYEWYLDGDRLSGIRPDRVSLHPSTPMHSWLVAVRLPTPEQERPGGIHAADTIPMAQKQVSLEHDM